MGSFGLSTMVVEGANAKKVYDFLLEMARNTPYKYDIKPLRIGDKECESYLICREAEEGEEVENGVWIYLFSLCDGRFESLGASYGISLINNCFLQDSTFIVNFLWDFIYWYFSDFFPFFNSF